MTTESLRQTVDALKALPSIVFGPQWRIRLSGFAGNLSVVIFILAQMDWSQGDLAALFPAAWKPILGKLSLGAAALLKLTELWQKRRRDITAIAPLILAGFLLTSCNGSAFDRDFRTRVDSISASAVKTRGGASGEVTLHFRDPREDGLAK